jgi:hypothetical protein
MTPRRVHEDSLRPDSLFLQRLLWAVGISLAFHALCFGGYELGKKFNVWNAFHLPAWVQKSRLLMSVLEEQKKQQEQQREIPLVFVDVNPQLATPEPPKDAKFYSNKNSQAANPDADKEADDPKITGKQTDIIKAEDVDRSKFDRLQPNFQKAPQEQQPEQARPRTPQPVGDLAMAKPETELRKDTGTADQARPRTIKEAMMRQNRNQRAGEKIKQDGGVKRRLEFTSLDAKATPFGNYDAAFIEAVESRWFSLLDAMSYDGYRRGRVVVKFHLNYDGRITDMEIVENSVGDTLGLLCQKAVMDPAPFDKWPMDLRRLVAKDYREIQFAFYYN